MQTMTISTAKPSWAPLIRMVVYPIQFETMPLDHAERIIEAVVDADPKTATRTDYIRAIDAALASDEELAALVPQPHDERVIRTYLRGLVERLRLGVFTS